MTHLASTAIDSPGKSCDLRPLSLRLREETRAIHTEVETGTGFNRLIVALLPERGYGSDVDAIERARDQYRSVYHTFLIAAYGFESAVLDAISECGLFDDALSAGYAQEAARTPDLILADLATIPRRSQLIGKMPGLPAIGCLAEFAGVEYVRRGSRKGNAVISRSVRLNLGFDGRNGAAFLNMDGRETNPRFDQFKRWLDALDFAEDEQVVAVQAAIHTFEAVGNWHRSVERNAVYSDSRK